MSGMTPDIVAFLRARLAEDAERQKNPLTAWHDRDCESLPDVLYPDREPGACDCGVPERLLAEVESKQRIVEETWGGPDHVEMWEHHVRLLALPYAGHEDYRAEWRL